MLDGAMFDGAMFDGAMFDGASVMKGTKNGVAK